MVKLSKIEKMSKNDKKRQTQQIYKTRNETYWKKTLKNCSLSLKVNFSFVWIEQSVGVRLWVVRINKTERSCHIHSFFFLCSENMRFSWFLKERKKVRGTWKFKLFQSISLYVRCSLSRSLTWYPKFVLVHKLKKSIVSGLPVRQGKDKINKMETNR